MKQPTHQIVVPAVVNTLSDPLVSKLGMQYQPTNAISKLRSQLSGVGVLGTQTAKQPIVPPT
jgi:hypothetical protein